jgi:aldehyde:ferredoxin oxidoreductase
MNQQDLFCLVNCAGICLFATFALSLKQIAPFLHTITGLEPFSSPEVLLQVGERVNNLVRLFNLREGLTKELDTLPSRFLKEPLNGGPCNGRMADIEQLISEYYFVRGWDEEGKPTQEKVRELGIDGGQ